jgi:hypothetical protein
MVIYLKEWYMRMPISIKFAKVFKYSILIILMTMPLGMIVDAASTRVFLDPPSQTVGALGDSFTVNVSIAYVSNLYGYGFKLYYDSTVMNGTQVIDGSFLKSQGQTYFLVVNFTDYYDSTRGVVAIVCTLLGNVPGKSGSGVLATIEFKSLAVATSNPLNLTGVELGDNHASPIPHEDVDGTVTVIPEFTSLVAFSIVISASLFSILFGKWAMNRVRTTEREPE